MTAHRRFLIALAALVCGSLPGCGRPAIGPPDVSVPATQQGGLEIPIDGSRGMPAGIPAAYHPWKPSAPERDWKYIVIHHTATARGSVESIDRTHRQRRDRNGNPWRGIGYHFVIGNGNGMGDGVIEATFRWRGQMPGAHAGVGDYNRTGIGIALIGNFENTAPTSAQLAALKGLVRTFSNRYAISSGNVIGHKDVKSTACPGRLFPLDEVRSAATAQVDLPRSATQLADSARRQSQ